MIKFGNKIVNELNGDINYFITSDLHFYHKNILKFCPETRPFQDIHHMVELLIQHWNSIVKEDDVILHLGDFSFGDVEQTKYLLSRLNGHIVFIYGNHDKVLRNHISGLTAYDYLEFMYNGTKVCCSHYPMACWVQQGRGSVMLHGHTHGDYQGKGRTIDVGWDNFGAIMKLDSVINSCLSKEIYTPDSH